MSQWEGLHSRGGDYTRVWIPGSGITEGHPRGCLSPGCFSPSFTGEQELIGRTRGTRVSFLGREQKHRYRKEDTCYFRGKRWPMGLASRLCVCLCTCVLTCTHLWLQGDTRRERNLEHAFVTWAMLPTGRKIGSHGQWKILDFTVIDGSPELNPMKYACDV